MTPLFFHFDISPVAACLILAFWVFVFLALGVKDAGRKGWQKKSSDKWTKKDWQDYRRHTQHTLDEYNKWKREYIQSKGVNPDEE